MDRSARANYILTAVASVCLCYIFYAILAEGPAEPRTVVGLALAIPAALLLVAARIQLGSSFAVKATAKHLVTSGIYSKIRHPIYFFAQVTLLGLLLCVFRPLFLVVWCLLLVIQVVRANKEDKVLEEKFGDEYRLYKNSTWF
jgi:protein-S-isoprenylcysteine O-methyltransferase Ste14